jgi:hypothetical protein
MTAPYVTGWLLIIISYKRSKRNIRSKRKGSFGDGCVLEFGMTVAFPKPVRCPKTVFGCVSKGIVPLRYFPEEITAIVLQLAIYNIAQDFGIAVPMPSNHQPTGV